MGNPTYTNQLTLEEVSLALEHILIAPYATAWTPARIDVDSPPVGFHHLGAVQDDSPQITVSKDLYTLDTGIPAVRAYQATIRIAGEFSIVLHSHTNALNYFATGGLPAWNLPATGGAGDPVQIYGIASGSTRTTINVTTNVGFSVNDMVIIDTTVNGAINSSRNYGWVTNIASGVLTLDGTGVPRTPTTGDQIIVVQHSRLALGTSVIPKFRILGVADFIDGAQVVHDMQNAQPRGQWAEALRNGQDPRTPLTFDLLGYTVTSPYGTSGQVVVAERFWFPPTTIQ